MTIILVPFAFSLTLSGLQDGGGQNPTKPKARKIPGITAKDDHPRGCVDCHINYVNMKLDVRFATLLKQWKRGVAAKILGRAQRFTPEGVTLEGRHPPVGKKGLRAIPATCIQCHDKISKKAPSFAPMVHALHLEGGDSNDFMTIFQGECTHCHKRSPSTGRWTIPSAPER